MAVNMDTELVKAIYIRPDGVYLNCKQKGGDAPYRQRKSDRLTLAYKQGGQKGLDVEFVKMLFWDYGAIRGDHPSVARFRPCVEKEGRLYSDARIAIENKYKELGLTDEMLREPDERLSEAAKAWQAFQGETVRKLYEQMADLADPPQDKKRDAGAR